MDGSGEAPLAARRARTLPPRPTHGAERGRGTGQGRGTGRRAGAAAHEPVAGQPRDSRSREGRRPKARRRAHG